MSRDRAAVREEQVAALAARARAAAPRDQAAAGAAGAADASEALCQDSMRLGAVGRDAALVVDGDDSAQPAAAAVTAPRDQPPGVAAVAALSPLAEREDPVRAVSVRRDGAVILDRDVAARATGAAATSGADDPAPIPAFSSLSTQALDGDAVGRRTVRRDGTRTLDRDVAAAAARSAV